MRLFAADQPSLIAHMSGADVFGLIVTLLIIAYLFYALIRGEKF